MANLAPYKNVHTIFLNTNVIEKINGLDSLTKLTILNLSFNRIKKVEGLKKLKLLHTLDLTHNFI